MYFMQGRTVAYLVFWASQLRELLQVVDKLPPLAHTYKNNLMSCLNLRNHKRLYRSNFAMSQ